MGTNPLDLLLKTVSNLAKLEPSQVKPFLPRLSARVAQLKSNEQQHFVPALGYLGRAADSDGIGGEAAMHELIKILQNPFVDQGIDIILRELQSLLQMGHLLPAQLGPYIGIIKEISAEVGGDAAAIATELTRIQEGRGVDDLHSRVDAVEHRINEMNVQISEACGDFEEVKKYVDDNIADVKDFVGDIAKRLPTPCQFSVLGTARKSLLLHFECCRSNPGCLYNTTRPFTTETQEWNKWLKMGFSLVKCGKAALDIGMGNPLGLAKTGVDAIQGIYDAYKVMGLKVK